MDASPNGNPNIVPTSGRQWRKAREEGFIVPLPSGNIVKLRPVSLDQLLMAGKIPDILSPVAARSLWAETPTDAIAVDAEMSKHYVELINLIVPMALMSPRIVDKPTKDDEISLDDLDFSDKLGIFNLVMQPTEVLRNFRDEQSKRLALASYGQDIRPETELIS